jgi:hypothetical protein
MIPIVAGLLMGAAMGGGIAALQKKNVLEGALMGAVGGAAGSFLMPAAGAAGALGGEAVGTAGASILNPAVGASGMGASTASAPSLFGQNVLTNSVTSGGFPSVIGPSAVNVAAPMTVAPLTTPALGATTTSAGSGIGNLFEGGIGEFLSQNKGALTGGGLGGMLARTNEEEEKSKGNIREFGFNPGERNPLFGQQGEKYYTADRGFTPGKVTPVEDYTAANGGIIALAEGGDLETQRYERPMRQVAPEVAAYNAQLMERANAQYNINPRPGPNQVPGFDSGLIGINPPQISEATETTTTTNQPFVPTEGSVYADLLAKKKKKEEGEKEAEKEGGYRPYESWAAGDGGQKNGGRITQRYNQGGISSLGTYSDGGQLLRGPGDGVSDDIPAQIGARQPARLADGEFVVPARVVSELGNGSTDAGAKRLYAMMDRVQKNRRKSVGKGKVAVDSKAYKHLPA